MPKLTIEKLIDHDPQTSNPDALVLCVDGEVVEHQIKTEYICVGRNEIPIFRVEFERIGNGPALELKTIEIN